ncbi:tyrosine-type recombinase/integrase [Levilactobacillus bambusae]|nr:tyrosine-type recombinase/integrase [Levilactobacillus bambusae]
MNDLVTLKSQANPIKWAMNDGQTYDFLFSDKQGKPYCLTTPNRWWKAYNQELVNQGKLKTTMTFHKIRATALSMFANDLNLPIEVVQKIAGHTDTQVTQRYYIKNDNSKMMALGKQLSFA